MRKRSASANRVMTKSWKRDIIPGRPRGGEPTKSAPPGYARLLIRLRRCELAVAYLSGEAKTDAFDIDSFVKAVLELHRDAGRSPDEGSQIPVPQEGAPTGEGS